MALAPGRASRVPINYRTKEGMELYKAATKSLYDGTDYKFDLGGDGLLNLIEGLQERTSATGWQVFDITYNVPGATAPATGGPIPTITKNLLLNYGEISLEQVRDQADRLYTANNRTTQEDYQLYACLSNSITVAAKNTLNLHQADFLIRNERSGICFLRVILREAQIDTRNTNNRLLQQLTAGLPRIMASHGNNIKAFNEEVQSLLKRVTARGCNPGSLVPQLLLAYAEVEEEGSFGRFIERIKDDYSRGREDFTDMQLMAAAQTKYEELVEENQFKGGSKKEDAIVSLTAQLEALETRLQSIGENGSPIDANGNPIKKKKKKKKGDKAVEEWMSVPPKDGESHTKTIIGDDKPWYWCPGNGAHKARWVRHKPSECKGLKDASESEPKEAPKGILKDKSKKEEETKKVGWSSGMLAKIRGTLSDSDSE